MPPPTMPTPTRMTAGARRRSLAVPGAVAGRPGEPQTFAVSQSDLTQFEAIFQPGAGIFSPGYPLAPVQPEQVRVYDFPVGVNYIYTPRSYEPVDFATLRGLAENHDITRLAIETRKDQVESQDWIIKSIDDDDPAADAPSRIKAVTEFWHHPDGENTFGTWMRKAMEDLLVIDAPAFEIRRSRKGDIIGVDCIAGDTIKPLIDNTGRRPLPPAPAYEQVIHGRPWRLLTTDELIYQPRNLRPHKIYGYSPVEQILLTVNIGLRRQHMQLQHFTEGNVPAGYMASPDTWNAQQIRQYQEWFDSMLAGNTAEKTKLVWGPAGSKYQPFKEAPYKDDFDEWLARVVLYAFSLPPSAFTKQVNRATAATMQEAALEEGLAPLMGWVKRLADGVIQRRMGHPDLEFSWEQQKSLDALDQSTILVSYVKTGLHTINEGRSTLGLDPVPDGDTTLIYTPSAGAVTLDSILNPPEPVLPPAAPGVPGSRPPGQAAQQPGKPGKQPGKPGAPQGKQPAKQPPAGAAKKAAADRLAKSEGHVDPDNAVPVSLPLVDPVTEADVRHIAWQAVRDGVRFEERSVPVTALMATQAKVDKNRVARDTAKYRDHGQEGEELPLVVQREGDDHYYILAGHHHTEGAIAAGAKTMRVLVITSDKPVGKGTAKTLYVSRRLKNTADLRAWAKAQGFKSTLAPTDMHVTVAFSKTPLDWDEVGDSFDEIRISGGQRSVEQMGDEGATVLCFESVELTKRWQQICDAGASWEHAGFKPHVSISYRGAPADLAAVEPYDGKLVFGPERFAEVSDDWKDNLDEKEVVAKGQTMSQAAAGYVDHPVDGDQCDGCTMFLGPDRCTLVQGEIAPDGHCEFFDAEVGEKAAASTFRQASPASRHAEPQSRADAALRGLVAAEGALRLAADRAARLQANRRPDPFLNSFEEPQVGMLRYNR